MKTKVQNKLQSVNSSIQEHDSASVPQEWIINSRTANSIGFCVNSIYFECSPELNLIRNCCLSSLVFYLMIFKVSHCQKQYILKKIQSI